MTDIALEFAEKVRLLGLPEDKEKAVADVVFWAMEQVTPAVPPGIRTHYFECVHCGVGNHLAANWWKGQK